MVRSARPSATLGYQGVHKRAEAKGPTWHVAMRRGKLRKLNEFIEPQFLAERVEKMKASIRAKVEHPFHVIKNLFRHKKTRYKGLAKNTAQLFSLFGLANLVIAKRALLEAPLEVRLECERQPLKRSEMPVHGCASRLRRLKHAIGLPHIVDRAITLIYQHLLSATVRP